MIQLDLTEQELKDLVFSIEEGTLTADECYENIMTFQTKNRRQ